VLPADRFDRSVPDSPVLGAVLLHPHPSYGGDRHNAVVGALFRALPAAGVASVRFDFASDDVAASAADGVEAIDLLPGDLGVVVAGYSFGAVVAAEVLDERVVGWVLVAPPFGAMRSGAGRPIAGDDRPKLVLVAAHDQFCPPEVARQELDGWVATEIEEVPGADHFLAGATGRVADRVADWFSRVAPRGPA
jgi:alpha/beta superfamily hydrolase